VFSLVNANFSDTVVLPIREGIVGSPLKRVGIYHTPMEIAIYPTKYFEVQSCSKGTALSITVDEEKRFMVIIKSDSTFFTYIVDSVVVKKNQLAERGQIIGKLRRDKNAEPLIFAVSKMARPVEPSKYIIYNKK